MTRFLRNTVKYITDLICLIYDGYCLIYDGYRKDEKMVKIGRSQKYEVIYALPRRFMQKNITR